MHPLQQMKTNQFIPTKNCNIHSLKSTDIRYWKMGTQHYITLSSKEKIIVLVHGRVDPQGSNAFQVFNSYFNRYQMH
jgi:hypothetical protein